MKKIIYTLLCFHLLSYYSFAQDPNVLLGLHAPAYGVRIKMNIPGYTGGWARGFTVSDENNNPFFGIGGFGNATNGVMNFERGWIGKSHDDNYMSFLVNGNVGVGVALPSQKLEVAGNIRTYGGIHAASNSSMTVNNQGAYLNWNDGTFSGATHIINQKGGGAGGFLFQESTLGNVRVDLMAITGDGNVGIGTTKPNEKLSVNGKIRAHEVKVETANWPDYVFKEDYKLKSLSELETFIKQNKHLPEVPSAKEVEQNGLELGEMNKVLLKKIEELTLHLIEKDKQLKETNSKVEELADKVKKLIEKLDK